MIGEPALPGKKPRRPAPPPLRLMKLPKKSSAEPKEKPDQPGPIDKPATDKPAAPAKPLPDGVPAWLGPLEKPDIPVIAGRVILMPGGSGKLQVSYAGAARVVLKHPPPAKGAKPAKYYDLVLEASAEPRLLGFTLLGVPTITRAVDEHGQRLSFVLDPPLPGKPRPNPADLGPLIDLLDVTNMPARRLAPEGMTVRLQPGAKPARKLRELSGALVAQVLVPNSALATVDNVLKAGGKSFPVHGGGRLLLDAVSKAGDDDYAVTIKLEGLSTFPGTASNGPLRNNALVFGGATPVTDLQAELFDAAGHKLPYSAGPNFGIESDAEGQPLRTVVTGNVRREKGHGEPARLVLTGMYGATVTIPFRFSDVPLP
jgi:hypothetical protein